jgi:hypothetical protein
LSRDDREEGTEMTEYTMVATLLRATSSSRPTATAPASRSSTPRSWRRSSPDLVEVADDARARLIAVLNGLDNDQEDTDATRA